MKNLLPIYYLNGGIYYRLARRGLQILANNLPIIYRFFRPIYRFAPVENARADQNRSKPATMELQSIIKMEHYRLKQDSVKHPVELKENATPYRIGTPS
jgi:hypothetical protein